MTEGMLEVMKFLAGVITALATVWVARIIRGGTLAETLRQEQNDIREWLKKELAEVRAEHTECSRRLGAMEATLNGVRNILRVAVDRRAKGMPFDEEMGAALAKLEQTDDTE